MKWLYTKPGRNPYMTASDLDNVRRRRKEFTALTGFQPPELWIVL